MNISEINFKYIFILFLLFALPANSFAEERYIPEMGIWLVIEEEGPPNSDYIFLNVRTLDKERNLSTKFPPLVGPIHASSSNKQLFCCESNAIVGKKEAVVYSLDGSLVFSFKHSGFLRGCGVTENQRLYWLHYNIIKDTKPINLLFVLDCSGNVVYKKEFRKGQVIKFFHRQLEYSIYVPDAEWPG